MNKIITTLSIMIILIFSINKSMADSMPIPMKTQVVMFLKILPYDYELEKRNDN